jgi:hypothetical protein
MTSGRRIGIERRVRVTLTPVIHRIHCTFLGSHEWEIWEFGEHVDVWSVERLEVSSANGKQASSWSHDHYELPGVVARLRWRIADWRSNRRLSRLVATARALPRRTS